MGFSFDEGRQYEAPLEVNTIQQAAEEIEKLTLDHVYQYKPKDTPYLGVITDHESLINKFNEFQREGLLVKGITAHCSTGIEVKEVNKKIKTVSFFVYSEDGKDGMYLDYIMDLQDIESFNPKVSDNEIEEMVNLVKEKFGILLTRRASMSSMWGEF